ncbi:MAG: hypothetical protein AAGH90_06865 [Pseudomonadota bacterium]
MKRFMQILVLTAILVGFGIQAPVLAQDKTEAQEKRVTTPSAPFVRRASPSTRSFLEQDEPQLGEPPQAPEAGLLEFNPMAGREVVVIEESPALSVLRTSPEMDAGREDNTPPQPASIKEGEIRDANTGIMFDATIQEFRWSSKRPTRLAIGFRNTISEQDRFAFFCNPDTGEVLDDPYASPAFQLIKDDLGAPIRIWLWQYEIGSKRRNRRWRRGSSEPEFIIHPSRYYCIESFFLSASEE